MPISQNLRFAATVPTDAEFDHPPGAALMRRLASELAAADWNPSEMENWRDCGWSLVCRRGSSELEVSMAENPGGEWMLQVSPHRVPGLSGLFGGKPSAAPDEVYELALTIHGALATMRSLGSPRWRWDGFPEDGSSTPEPQAI